MRTEQAQQFVESQIPEMDLSAVLRVRPLLVLLELIGTRNPTLGMHGESVGELAALAAVNLGMSPAQVERLRLAGVLHDIGKVAISDRILEKEGPLSAREWEEIQRHPLTGSVLVESAGLPDVAEWILKHHERPDGRGYPNGLTAEDIPLEASILSIVDAYHAMVAERPYQGPLTHLEAKVELQLWAGKQFDAEMVAVVLDAIESRYGDRALDVPWGCR